MSLRFVIGVLLLASLISAIGVVHARYRHRQLFIELSRLEKARDELNIEFSRLQLEQLGIAEAAALDEGELVALLLQPVRPLEMAGLVLRGALGRLGEAERVLRFGFSRLGVRPSRIARRRIKVAIDGELTWLDAPLTFRVSPRPLWLVKPDRVGHG